MCQSLHAVPQGRSEILITEPPPLQCSVDCGRGTQVRTVFCAGFVGGMFQEFPDEACPRITKPARVQPCGNSSCKPAWFTTKWREVQYIPCLRTLLILMA